ncbi:SPOR domain-containing protein [Deinococcus sp. YIM 77859]|uniref:SPOR domain-containing protein n=1 Tax=Deinococcus sp. YIM 77859 TaxID=1540221 RepID=UPI0005550052|nr:SPOR domain-containing protein [Deinococcus sp. YIM 77859]
MSRADARPRRWPDLLIGLLVLLLLAGFGLLLLEQRPERVAQAPTSPVVAAEDAPVIPSAPGTDLGETEEPVTPSPAPDTSRAAEDAAGLSSPPEEAASPAPATPSQPQERNTATATSSPTARPEGAEVPVVPAEPIPAAPPAPSPPTVTLTTPPANPGALDTAAGAPGAATPRAGGAVPTSEQRTPLRSDYRISLGTFSSEALAQNNTASVRNLGYTVYPIDLGDQVVAQVGPFADEATARQALADIQRAYPQAVLYPPRGRRLTEATATEDTGGERTETAPSEDTSSASAGVPAPSEPVYLQVGAFDRVESAQRMVGMLREQGYTPTVNAPEGKKVTVLIGPFSGDALLKAEENLDANGFDHFRVR